MDQNKTPLFDAVMEYINADITPFHIPSHKMGNGINKRWKDFVGNEIFKMDLCEVQGLDDIYQASGVIKEAQELAAELWGAKESFFLVNGTSSGILASICSVVKEGDKIIIPRNSHKSVVYAMIISGATPIYFSTEIYKEKGLVGGVDPKKLNAIYDANLEAKGVLVASPSYHGICSDMNQIAEITHAHHGIFIADEAHGNHMYFHDQLPTGALELGVDISCQSIHKMSGSLTQSSMLHLNTDKIDRSLLKFNLQMFQNTSPSYLLEVSLDLARHQMANKGHEILDNLLKMSSYARQEISRIDGFEILGEELIGEHCIYDYDSIRLVFTAKDLGLEGYELYRILRDEYHVEMEFGDYFYGLCIMGIGTTWAHVDRLVEALKDISFNYKGQRDPLDWNEELPPLPPQIMTPRKAYFAKTKNIPWSESKGEISAEMIVPYPPGIPTICPGEEITNDVWNFLEEQRKTGRHLHGPAGGTLDCIKVVAE